MAKSPPHCGVSSLLNAHRSFCLGRRSIVPATAAETNVRFGSVADIRAPKRLRPLSATSGHAIHDVEERFAVGSVADLP